MRYQYISYGLVGNEKDGYEVNDAHTTDTFVELSEADLKSDTALFHALKREGFITKKRLRVNKFSTEGDENTIYLTYGVRPEGELRRVDNPQ